MIILIQRKGGCGIWVSGFGGLERKLEIQDVRRIRKEINYLTDYRPRGHDVIRIANAELYSRKYSDTNKESCTA